MRRYHLSDLGLLLLDCSLGGREAGFLPHLLLLLLLLAPAVAVGQLCGLAPSHHTFVFVRKSKSFPELGSFSL